MQITTVRFPISLYNEAKAVVANGTDLAVDSLNDLVVDSVREHLWRLGEARLDAEFARMRNDQRYQEHAKRVASEFERSDWDALRTVERE